MQGKTEDELLQEFLQILRDDTKWETVYNRHFYRFLHKNFIRASISYAFSIKAMLNLKLSTLDEINIKLFVTAPYII